MVAAAAAARPPSAIDTGEGPSKRGGASATQATATATATANLRGWFAGDWATDDKIDLLAQTYTVFSSLQRIAAESKRASKPGLVPPAQTLQYYHRISGLYREAIRRYMEAVAARTSGGEDYDDNDEEEEEERELELSQSIHTTLHLAETLYLPVDGRGAGVVGEEVLHWLNSFDFAPRTEDGQAIAQAAVPYEHPSYWDYILRCVLRGFHTTAASLLGSLASSHPSHALRGVASRVAKLLASLPRSTSFALEHDFLAAHRRWLGQVRALLAGLEGDMDDMERELGQSRGADDEDGDGDGDDVEDERLELEAQFRCLVELMAGVRDRVFEACENWTEALGAWGVLVQPALKRDDVPETMAAILGRFSVDEARRPGDAVQAALARGDVSKACEAATRVDPWLAAHLADLVAKAGVLDEGAAHERNHLVAVYAETLLDDQGLWRMAIDYLATCDGSEADRASTRRRMAAILVSIDLVGPHAVAARPRARPRPIDELEAEQRRAEEMMDDDEEDGEVRREREEAQRRRSASDEVARIEEVLLACREHGMEREARRVCSRVARQLLARRRYGEAVAFCRRADDARGIRRIVARILDVYICDGADAFCALVDAMPPSLLAPGGAGLDGDIDTDTAAADDDADAQLGFALSTRLAFLAQYRDFHRLYAARRSAEAGALLVEMLSSDSCPQPFYAVLLVDAIPLLMRGSDGLEGEGEGEEEEQDEQQGFTNDETMELLRILDVVMAASSRHERLARHYLGPLQRLLVGPSPNGTAAGQAKTQGQRQSQGQAGQKGLVEEAEAEEEEDEEEGEEEEEGKGDVFDVQASTRRLDILRLALAKRLADIL
ncbi:hypothetical protein FA10DRAFT_299740 [Acaromyces ingoldii]|uniref:Nuclear pore complex protein Nup85 n=1 Tax=Acaromyces ingoldii TaxID=215250 RepID=A0A316YR07_9BASI|nr:hypothetical protein FA10DRAFT_299740 [Acaromyces ingoldii]PWN91098.1 hypothetical protein FA10DRAFT_299740 [Acaromyces ingoldii]